VYFACIHILGKEMMISFYAVSKNILLLTVLVFASTESLCLSDCTIFIDPSVDCETKTCNDSSSCNFVYSNFTHALSNLYMLCGGNSVKINLMSGEHFIEQYGIKISKDITIQGQNNTVINCGDIGNDQDVTSLLLFYNTRAVELNSLEFNACQRPIRFNNINNLTVSQCIFRYEFICVLARLPEDI